MEKEEQMKEKKCKERNNYFKNRKQKKRVKNLKKDQKLMDRYHSRFYRH